PCILHLLDSSEPSRPSWPAGVALSTRNYRWEAPERRPNFVSPFPKTEAVSAPGASNCQGVAPLQVVGVGSVEEGLDGVFRWRRVRVKKKRFQSPASPAT